MILSVSEKVELSGITDSMTGAMVLISLVIADSVSRFIIYEIDARVAY